MIEIRIHGRGGQGGVTLAKILAAAEHLEGRSVQAFGIYAAERSGAPLQAFVRVDEQPIRNPNMIYEPDHIIVLDPTLISRGILDGLKPGGLMLLNSPEDPEHFAMQPATDPFRVATVDAHAIALEHGLGTRALPIVNTALAGAAARMLGFSLQAVLHALEEMGFHSANLAAARKAHAACRVSGRPPRLAPREAPVADRSRSRGLPDGNLGAFPAIHTGAWASRQPQQHEGTPPCNFVCPAGNDVQGFLDALANGRVDEGLEILLRTTPLPSVCGRVCPGFCMQQCNRRAYDGAVNVRALERYAGDYGSADIGAGERRPQRVAVVGSGPAGLSGAYHLARLGYGVRIYEAGKELGGLMRTGIPVYRLPRASLDRDIERILNLGVEVQLDTRVDRTLLAEIATEFDAVLLATGLQRLTSLDLGLEVKRVTQGLEFLDLARSGAAAVTGERVVVVGGGNTAVDAARTAWRLGASEVRIVYRRTRAEMPAISEEVDEALDEGILIDFLCTPREILAGEGEHALLCQRMELGPADESGRRRPVPIEGAGVRFACDRVILALGQAADTSLLPEDVAFSPKRPGCDANGGRLYAAGDLLNNEGTVTAAIGCGRDMALRFHQHFSGEHLLEPRPDEATVVRADQIHFRHFAHAEPGRGASLPVAARQASFAEVHAGLAGPEEAQRCLSCGVCNACDRCVTWCPDGVLRRQAGRLVFDYDYCKGCGVCVEECSRAVLHMEAV
jgi:2-oxoacid:acceptor oxidoreductase gamma subunit (pyruvate/2-ketoisovalerate family)